MDALLHCDFLVRRRWLPAAGGAISASGLARQPTSGGAGTARNHATAIDVAAVHFRQPLEAQRGGSRLEAHRHSSHRLIRGSVETIHAEHVNRKDKNGNKWKGIGYHFLIGNGTGMSDGKIEPTFRWKQQMQGAHAGNDEYNQYGIGICLVGNFQDHRPSTAQLASIKRLVGVLKKEYGLKSSQVVGHRDVKSTACPGKFFR